MLCLDAARISRDRCISPGGPVLRWYTTGPVVSKGAPLTLDLGPQLAPDGPDWGLSFDGGLRHFKRAKLATGLMRIRRKFVTTTPHRRVRGPAYGSTMGPG